MKKLIIFLMIMFYTLLPTFAKNILPTETAIVKNIEYIENSDLENQFVENVSLEIKTGKFKGESIELKNVLSGNPLYDLRIKKGQHVILYAEDNGEGVEFAIQDIKRSNNLIYLVGLFIFMLLFVGKKQGLFSFISIFTTILLLIYFLCPCILAGINPIFITLVVALISTIITMYFVGGFNAKSSSATLGTLFSLFFAVILSLIITKTASLTGFVDEYSMFLFAQKPNLNFISITISCVILSSLGAVMDVAMSISSTINELYETDDNLSIKELFVSGMNVGRDIIGTMANTLILVYIGSAMPILLTINNVDFEKFINLNFVVTEIASALIGSISIIACVPITAFIASFLINKYYKKNIPILDCK